MTMVMYSALIIFGVCLMASGLFLCMVAPIPDMYSSQEKNRQDFRIAASLGIGMFVSGIVVFAIGVRSI
jgi:hypothetical protein